MRDLLWKKKMVRIQKCLMPWKDGTPIKMTKIEKEVQIKQMEMQLNSKKELQVPRAVVNSKLRQSLMDLDDKY